MTIYLCYNCLFLNEVTQWVRIERFVTLKVIKFLKKPLTKNKINDS